MCVCLVVMECVEVLVFGVCVGVGFFFSSRRRHTRCALVTGFRRVLFRSYVVGVLLLAYTLSFVDRMILSLLVAPIRTALDISDTEVSLLIGLAFALFYTLLGLTIAWIADRWNRRNLILAGIALWSAMTAG